MPEIKFAREASLYRSALRFAQATSLILAAALSTAFAQSESLTLSSATTTAGGAATLNLSLSSFSGSQPATIQWTLQYSSTSIQTLSATAGPFATAAGKSLTCAAGTGSYTCILAGLNSNVLQNGVVAVINATLSSAATGAIAIQLVNPVAAFANGSAATISGSGGTITAGSSAPVSVSLSPGTASLTPSQSVQFSATVANTTNTAVNWSLNPAAGTLSSTGYYVAPSSFSSTQTVTVTATSAADSTKSASATVTLNPLPASSSGPSGPPYHINAGGGSVTDTNGVTWTADTDFSGGSTYSIGSSVANSSNPVYSSSRYGAFTYTFPATNANYTVTLKFAELYFAGPGQRQFNVSLNGSQVLTNFDIFAQAGGALLAVDRSFPVTVTNGQIQIQFTNGAANNPMVNGIDIEPATAAAASYHINSGGPAVIDASGISWAADTGFSGGSTYSTPVSIANTPNPVYSNCRYGAFTYTFPAPNANYTVTLKFAELYFAGPGQRLFNVSINGTQVLSNFDIYAQAGGEFLAIDHSFPVTVTNGQIQIQFTNGAANNPMVNGIDIEPASAASYRMNSGGSGVTDAAGILWAADADFSGGSTYSTAASIANTTNPVYNSCRYGTFTYSFPVTNGNHTVTLKFAELYAAGPGQRQFNVSINGTQVLNNFDIYAQAGGQLIAIDESFSVNVTNGGIQIQFTNGAAGNPLVNGVEID